ncbi:MAG TPA: hypothetical protein VFT09_08655, partial [Ilumatobacteraceae bacterium]|nr:hypothetical protein [Ilumatobacteraceae bacterium]
AYTAPPSAPAHRSTRVVVAVLATAVAALTVTAAVVALRDGSAAVGDVPQLPRDARQRWSATVDDVVVGRVVGSSRALVLTDDDRHQIVVLDARTGRERWRRDGDVGTVAVVGGHVVATEAHGDGRTAVVARSLDSGGVAWSRDLRGDERVEIERGQVLVATTPAAGRQRLELVDVATGRVAGAVDAARVTRSRAQVQARDGDLVTVYGRRRFERLGAVDLRSLGMGGPDVAVAISSAGPLVAAGATLVLVADDGSRRAELALAPFVAGATRVGIDVLDEAGRLVAVQQGDHLLVVAAEDGSLRELWSGSAWLVDWHLDAERELLAVAGRTGSIVAMPPQVVDVRTGEVVWDGPAAVQQSSPLRVFGGDGFISVQRDGRVGTAPSVVGYDLDRVEQWRRPIDRRAWPTLVDAGLVTVLPGPGSASTVTLYA